MLCSAGRVYEVERWIQQGKPIQAATYKRPRKARVVSPSLVAVRKKHRNLVLLLLCNGYRLDLDTSNWSFVLDEALGLRAPGGIELSQWTPACLALSREDIPCLRFPQRSTLSKGLNGI